ncbi:hypothetical protein HK097_005319 [Rhizophlyctis rosea]|uniref:F-box domain-containing protein n=1 Tax=Rhizophlyctis rosea TaxID=64517 RepID=A0AAD5X9T4_9FUNG|nr:hypothetical protein HK097_005319 [Rhizophlyctis rosea]
MDTLPVELLAHLATFLSIPALLSMQCACQTWRTLSLPLLHNRLRGASAVLRITTPSHKTLCIQYTVSPRNSGLLLTPASQKVLEANHYVVEGGKGSKWSWNGHGRKGEYVLDSLTVVYPFANSRGDDQAKSANEISLPSSPTPTDDIDTKDPFHLDSPTPCYPNYIPPTTHHILPSTPMPTSPTRTLYTVSSPDEFTFTYSLPCFKSYEPIERPWLVDWLTKDDIIEQDRMVEYFVPLDLWVSPLFLCRNEARWEGGDVTVERIRGGGEEGGDANLSGVEANLSGVVGQRRIRDLVPRRRSLVKEGEDVGSPDGKRSSVLGRWAWRGARTHVLDQ